MIKIGFIFIKKFYTKRSHPNTRFLITKYCLILYQQLKNLIKVKNVTFAIKKIAIFLIIYFSNAENCKRMVNRFYLKEFLNYWIKITYFILRILKRMKFSVFQSSSMIYGCYINGLNIIKMIFKVWLKYLMHWIFIWNID